MTLIRLQVRHHSRYASSTTESEVALLITNGNTITVCNHFMVQTFLPVTSRTCLGDNCAKLFLIFTVMAFSISSCSFNINVSRWHMEWVGSLLLSSCLPDHIWFCFLRYVTTTSIRTYLYTYWTTYDFNSRLELWAAHKINSKVINGWWTTCRRRN